MFASGMRCTSRSRKGKSLSNPFTGSVTSTASKNWSLSCRRAIDSGRWIGERQQARKSGRPKGLHAKEAGYPLAMRVDASTGEIHGRFSGHAFVSFNPRKRSGTTLETPASISFLPRIPRIFTNFFCFFRVNACNSWQIQGVLNGYQSPYVTAGSSGRLVSMRKAMAPANETRPTVR